MWMKIRAAAPEWPMFLTAFGVCLLMFLQLRIAAEFKDAVEDARWRSCRPVPRGVFILAAVIQLVLVFALDSRLWVVLALAAIQAARSLARKSKPSPRSGRSRSI
jgi:4-hydroxybenzoate polyprenyltransferase